MKGDFSRDTFSITNHFSRVLTQQGRVQLDADSNEQAAILLHYIQALAADLIGPHGGPQDNLGFEIVNPATLKADVRRRLEETKILPLAEGDFLIGPGHYYVNGLLCENEDYTSYKTQASFPIAKDGQQKSQAGDFLVYLDVWERHLTYLELEDADGNTISPREVALGGPDTATRAQIVWQVKTRPANISAVDARNYQKFLDALGDEYRPGTGLLKARAIQPAVAPEPCNIPPEARYRGPENQLYRVEIHLGDPVAQPGRATRATFKWSRENGSVIFPIRQINATSISLEGLGHDARSSLQAGDWVEIVDDDYTLQNRAGTLLQVDAIDYDDSVVILKDAPNLEVGNDPTKHPLLRRWDQHASDESDVTGDGIAIAEGDRDQNWIELEDGIEIQFQPGGTYHPGDYWLIPARTATGDVEWPGRAGMPAALEPRGIVHHYAPLWIITVSSAGAVTADVNDGMLRTITPIPLIKQAL